MEKTERHPPGVPKFRNEQEAAAFWDAQSPLDYPEDFQEVEVTVAKPLSKRGLTVKLAPDTIEQLTTIARQKGIGPTTLARMWILEHLQAEQDRAQTPSSSP